MSERKFEDYMRPVDETKVYVTLPWHGLLFGCDIFEDYRFDDMVAVLSPKVLAALRDWVTQQGGHISTGEPDPAKLDEREKAGK